MGRSWKATGQETGDQLRANLGIGWQSEDLDWLGLNLQNNELRKRYCVFFLVIPVVTISPTVVPCMDVFSSKFLCGFTEVQGPGFFEMI